jgi:hypothetical protein
MFIAAFVYTFHLTFGQELRHHHNGTGILSLHPMSHPIDNVKKHFMEEFQGLIKRVGNEDTNKR